MKNETEIGFDERYGKLNKAQKKAVDTVEGPVLVVAGPGSGKTEILSLRVGNILKQTDAAPSNILCLTFTDSAAINMRKRLAGLIGKEAYRVAIHTFHSFGVEVINRNPEFFYNGAHFIPADELAQVSIVENILKEAPHDNPLRSEHPEQGFVYTNPILKAISSLKKAGLTPSEFHSILKHNEQEQEYANPLLAELFDKRMSKAIFDDVSKLLSGFEGCKTKTRFPVEHLGTWLDAVSGSLARALEEAQEEDKATALSKWKTRYMKKNDEGKRVHKDYLYLPKMYALAEIYEKYRDTMHQKSFYDFDDMLLETVQAVKDNDTLRYDLQEQFQYILVDEFQDTNDAQMRLLHLLSNNEVNEGRPNVMAVGDDDQAIYKFQGAEISNILNFKDTYSNPEIITMTENYRSTQDILDTARHIIQKGGERLENIIPELEKTLVASNPNIEKGDIKHKIFATHAHELCFVADEIHKMTEVGKNPEEIAVISRRHKDLMDMAEYLSELNVPIHYERQQNVFEETHIHQIITIARFISTLARKNKSEADEFLPEILSYPFWGIDRKTIWELSKEAEWGGKYRREWLDVMREGSDERLKQIAQFFDELSGKAQTDTLESVLDEIIGSHISLAAESEDEDIDTKDAPETAKSKDRFVSPFREYYFGANEFKDNTAVYLTFLSGLRVFIHSLREYKSGEILTLDDLVEFVDLHKKNNIHITDTSPFTGAKHAVNLMTAHKAKGLEFDTVFVISCQDDIWAAPARGNRLSFPENLKIAPAGDSSDDQIKLFYVAMTRAKSNLYLTSYTTKETGKESQKLRFLTPYDAEVSKTEDNIASILSGEAHNDKEEMRETKKVLERSWNAFHHPPFTKDERALLETLIEDYQMPVTHFNNFLNVADAGPQMFLEQNLLRFPQSMSPSAAYGSAMHKVVELAYIYLKKEGSIPKENVVVEWFENELKMKRLSPKDHSLFLKRGKDALSVYYKERMVKFDPAHKVEVDFKHQGVVVGDAHLTGKIDKVIDVGSGLFEVIDIKTGKSADNWQGKDAYEKVKLYKYKNQLIFYKLLIENSRDFMDNKRVSVGCLEFLEPKNDKIIDLRLEIDKEDVERVKNLIDVVYKKIMNLDMPDTSKYGKDIKGIKEFENDLLKKLDK